MGCEEVAKVTNQMTLVSTSMQDLCSNPDYRSSFEDGAVVTAYC